MNISDLPDDSDTSDEDYVPEGKQDLPSEVESDGLTEDALSEPEDPATARGQKRRKKHPVNRKKKKTNLNDSGTSEEAAKLVVQSDEEKKKQEEDIWADFMKDTGFKPKNSAIKVENTPKTTDNNKLEAVEKISKKTETVKVVKVFEFAGEEVTVEKEVAADSAEARLLNSAGGAPKTSHGRGRGSRGGLSGISNVLSQLGKKQKISTLEKSKLDWDKFKKEENLEEELNTHNKGKDGYLERQDFLQRADLRRFEIEREVRAIERNKRLNNTL